MTHRIFDSSVAITFFSVTDVRNTKPSKNEVSAKRKIRKDLKTNEQVFHQCKITSKHSLEKKNESFEEATIVK